MSIDLINRKVSKVLICWRASLRDVHDTSALCAPLANLWKTTSFAIPAQTTLEIVSMLKVDVQGDLQCSKLEYECHTDFPHRRHLKFPELVEISKYLEYKEVDIPKAGALKG